MKRLYCSHLSSNHGSRGKGIQYAYQVGEQSRMSGIRGHAAQESLIVLARILKLGLYFGLGLWDWVSYCSETLKVTGIRPMAPVQIGGPLKDS